MEHGELEKRGQTQSPSPAGKAIWKKAACCGSGALALVALGTVGPSLGALASGALSLVAVLACPVGMYLMMRAMMKQPDRQALAVPSAREEVVEGEVIEVKPMGGAARAGRSGERPRDVRAGSGRDHGPCGVAQRWGWGGRPPAIQIA